MKPRYTGTWRITEMEGWDTAHIDLAGPGYPISTSGIRGGLAADSWTENVLLGPGEEPFVMIMSTHPPEAEA